jgi:excisionase family DNA binding protein
MNLSEVVAHLRATGCPYTFVHNEWPEILSVPELADMMGVSPDTVLGWIRAKELKASNLNTFGKRPRWVVTRENLNEFLKRRQPDAKPQREKKRRPKLDGVIEFF